MSLMRSLTALASAAAALAMFTTVAVADTTIEFVQWWEPELPAGALRGIMDSFEAANPGIKVKLVSGPFSATHDQIVAGAASGTLSDVVGLDGAWVNELAKQGAIAPMDSLMDETKFDRSQMADIIKVDGKSYMFPLASFVYPVFVNLDIAKAAGVDKLPSTRTEFADAAKKMTHADKNQYGWVLPLSLQVPNGAQNDVMSWVWASGQSMLKDGVILEHAGDFADDHAYLVTTDPDVAKKYDVVEESEFWGRDDEEEEGAESENGPDDAPRNGGKSDGG